MERERKERGEQRERGQGLCKSILTERREKGGQEGGKK